MGGKGISLEIAPIPKGKGELRGSPQEVKVKALMSCPVQQLGKLELDKSVLDPGQM